MPRSPLKLYVGSKINTGNNFLSQTGKLNNKLNLEYNGRAPHKKGY